MSRSIRNTVFTAIVLVLTGVGVSWNEDVAKRHAPVAIGQTVLAQFVGDELATGDAALEVELSRPEVLLGQFQVASIRTVPFAALDLAVRLPDGTFDPARTVQATADELGRYNWRFQINDFTAVGQLEAIVKATAGPQVAARRIPFGVKTWNAVKAEEDLTFPLLP